ncbi:hypothetical protein [Agarivorans sp. OAG1]|uniref:hypothetical protein n=1 Tax=Agarivorans sp. OAG1 TaxID=3082387 RepID=UPI0030D2F405
MITNVRCRSCNKKVDTKTLRLAEDKYICQSCFNGLFKESFIPETLRRTFTPKESKTQGKEPFSSSALYGSLKVKEQTPNYLLLARSRRKLIENIVVRFVVVILWSLMLFSFPDNQDALIKLVSSNAALASKDILSAVIFLLFMIVPVLVIVDSFRVFKTIAAGQKYEFKKIAYLFL